MDNAGWALLGAVFGSVLYAAGRQEGARSVARADDVAPADDDSCRPDCAHCSTNDSILALVNDAREAIRRASNKLYARALLPNEPDPDELYATAHALSHAEDELLESSSTFVWGYIQGEGDPLMTMFAALLGPGAGCVGAAAVRRAYAALVEVDEAVECDAKFERIMRTAIV